ncbi:MAG TPA: Ig-like domain-containing protein [Polyangia bacterium]|nr:Ig-like domain-containing protein [Polyangia bacterium]
MLFLGCSPSSNPKPGAPVLTTLSIVEPASAGGSRWDVTKDTPSCPATYADGQDCDPTAFAICELDKNVVCHCDGTDMCTPTKGSLTCTYAPGSVVVALFDRILDTTAFDTKTPVATLTTDPANPAASAAADYSSAGSMTGLVFPDFFGVTGPTITLSGAPALPVDSTVTFVLDMNTVRAKDGKTAFTGSGPLANGTIAFKTGDFTVVSIAVPTAPPPMDMGGDMTPAAPTCPDAAMPMEMDAGADAAEGGTPDAEASGDGGTPDAGASADAGAATPPSTDVPANMDTGTVTITFSNPVEMAVLDHITFTEDGQPFTAVTVKSPDTTMMMTFPVTTIVYAPKTTWAHGKTYVVTVDPTAEDVFGAPLGGQGASATFTMAK